VRRRGPKGAEERENGGWVELADMGSAVAEDVVAESYHGGPTARRGLRPPAEAAADAACARR